MVTFTMPEQEAVDLHGVLKGLQIVAEETNNPMQTELRNGKLALEGGLRAAGWAPDGNGQWFKRPVRGRR